VVNLAVALIKFFGRFCTEIGVKAVNALSSWLLAEVRREWACLQQTYERGVPTGPVQPIRELEPGEGTGTFITFMPDETIFQEVREFHFNTLLQRFREMTYVIAWWRYDAPC